MACIVRCVIAIVTPTREIAVTRLKPIVVAFALLGGVLFAPANAFAHRMMIEAKVEAEVKVVVGYEDETPSEQASVKIQNAAKVTIAEATTDEKGVCTFARPKPGKYLLIAEDDTGHRATLELDIPGSPEEVVEVATPTQNRWAMGALGVGVIMLGSFVGRRLLSRKSQPE
jgi:uncharacterized GH25 family protein